MTDEVVLRVSQLDATELDDELSSTLQQQFLNVFKSLPLGFINRFKPELRLFVRWLVWKYSVHESDSTFGQQMMELYYNSRGKGPLSRRHRFGLFFFLVLAEWVRDRFDVLVSTISSAPPSTVQRALDVAVACLKGLSLLNFILFILYGGYPSLKERVLGLTMSPAKPQVLYQLSYEYMNREILWHGFSEFIFHILPHFNVFAVRNWLRKLVKTAGDKPDNVNYHQCAFCEQSPTMPRVADCGHVYCYYCLRANCMADANFPCSLCSRPVHNSIHQHHVY